MPIQTRPEYAASIPNNAGCIARGKRSCSTQILIQKCLPMYHASRLLAGPFFNSCFLHTEVSFVADVAGWLPCKRFPVKLNPLDQNVSCPIVLLTDVSTSVCHPQLAFSVYMSDRASGPPLLHVPARAEFGYSIYRVYIFPPCPMAFLGPVLVTTSFGTLGDRATMACDPRSENLHHSSTLRIT